MTEPHPPAEPLLDLISLHSLRQARAKISKEKVSQDIDRGKYSSARNLGSNKTVQ